MTDLTREEKLLIARWDRLNDAIDSEMVLIHNRLNGLLLFQGILFAAAIQAPRSTPSTEQFAIVLSVSTSAAVLIAFLVHLGVRAGIEMVEQYKEIRARLSVELAQHLMFEHIGADLNNSRHQRGLLFARYTPGIIIGVWLFGGFCLAIVTSYKV